LREVGVARELDPFSLIVNTNVAWILDFSGRYQAAIDQLRATLTIDSNYVQAHVRLAGALSSAGRFDEALAEAQRVVALTGRAPSGLGTLAVAQAEAGRKAEASATLTEILALARTQYVPPWTIGAAYAALGNVDSAVVWVERAFDERSNFIAYLAVEPLALTLRHNPRFQRLLTRAGYR
jgi:tetratricopeptide (TPR) repeat protein